MSAEGADADRLEISDLTVTFVTDQGDVNAVNGVTLAVAPG